jgi:hypothetical protein
VQGTGVGKFTVKCRESKPTNALLGFFTDENAGRKEITNERFIDRHFHP